MAQSKQTKVVPRLKDFHFSEETGFILPDPLVELPEYFEPWNKLNRDLAVLLKTHKLRAAVDQMPELDASSLSGHRQLRLAHTILCFISNGYIWQDGEDHMPKFLPRQLAIPYYSISQRLGMKPSMCFATMVLSNITRLDRSKPLALGNTKLICKLSDDEPFQWFYGVLAQSELNLNVAIKAVVKAMDAVLDNDVENVHNSLEAVLSAIHTLKATNTRMHEGLPGDYFLPNIFPFLKGYGGKGSKYPDGIIFEGACDTPVKAVSGSAGQSSTLHCLDVAFGIDHGDAQNYQNELRSYMPPAHAELITAFAQGPSIQDYVASSEDERLKALYTDCVSAIRDFRSYHIQMATKYIVIPSRQKGEVSTEERLIPFLKNVRDTTVSSV